MHSYWRRGRNTNSRNIVQGPHLFAPQPWTPWKLLFLQSSFWLYREDCGNRRLLKAELLLKSSLLWPAKRKPLISLWKSANTLRKIVYMTLIAMGCWGSFGRLELINGKNAAQTSNEYRDLQMTEQNSVICSSMKT